MAFDVEEYARKRRQNKSTDSEDEGNRNSGFDVEAYVKQRNLPQVGEYLTSSINDWLKKNESFVNSYNSRYSGENTTYRSDASDWLSSVATQKSSLAKEADGIRNILDQYKDYLDKDYYNSVAQALDGNLKMQGEILSASTKDYEYWSQWDTEDAYKEYVAQQEDYNKKLNFDLNKGQVEINDLQAIVGTLDRLKKEINATYNGYQGGARGYANEQKRAELQAEYDSWVSKYGDHSKLASTLSEKQAYYTLAERVQKAAELASVADVESENYDPAFATKSQYQSTEASGFDKLFSMYGMGYEDLAYEYINGDEDFRAEVNQKHDTWTIENPNVGGDTKSMFESAGYDYMNEQEVAIYNYYYNTEGKKKAQEYLDSIEESLQMRYGTAMAEGMKGKPVQQYIFAVEAGLDQFASGVAGIFSDEYKPTSATQVASGMVREDLADTGAKLPDWLGGGSLGQVGYDVINTTSNMLPSILASTAVNAVAPGAGAVVGAGLMGASAGGSAKQEMLNLGYSKEQANTYGLMVGAAEAGMEYLLGGISKLGGVLPDGIIGKILTKVDNAFARTAIKVGGSMLSEGFEEGLQTVIEPWLKEIATGVDWEDPSIDEVLYSSLLGALSAFGLEGAGVVAGEVGTYKSGKNVQKVEGGVAKLQAIGSTFSADTVAYKIAGKVNAQTDAYTIGRLLNEVGGTISEQNVTEIVNGLTQRGIDTNTATKLAKQYQAILNADMNISDEAKTILNNIPGLNSVLRENIINKNTTVYQRTKAYSDLMTLADETANRKEGVSTESKTDSLESLARSVAARGVDGRVAGVMASAVKSDMEARHPASSATEVSPADAEIMQRIASEVALGKRTSVAGQAIRRSVDSASATAAEKLGVEGKYTSSETGATRLANNRKKVNIVGVDSIKDGVMKVKLNDGTIVDADEIDFSTPDQALVYEAVTNMGVNPTTAWEILKAYDPKSGQSGTIYAMGALEAYTYGHNGVKVEGMSKDGFSALLSPVQRNTANRLGDIDARAKVEAQQKTLDKAVKSVRDEAKSKHKAIPKRNGGVVLEGVKSVLTDLQESQVNVLDKMAEGLGVTFHIFESTEDAKGKRSYRAPDGTVTGANGWYNPKTGEIWIDLHAGNFGQDAIIFTAAHELTHFIRQWSPAKFKVFADFLFEQYGKKGQDVNQLIQRQIEKAAANNRQISWDEAYEEVVADSCETFLRDSKAAEKVAALREKDKGLANKIKSFLGQMLAKMRKVMADHGLAPETPEGQMVAEMTDSLEKLYNLWSDALADAGEAYSTLADIDLDTDSVAPMLSERTWTASEYVTEREETAKEISKALGVDIKTAYKYIDDINSVARLIADDRARLDYEPNLDEHATVLKPNSDYKYSVDMSTLCAKRLLFTGTFDAIQRALPNTVFDSEDIVALREMMQKRGYEVACGICYVESTRREIGRITQDFINSYKESQKTGKPITRTNSEGKVVDLKKTNDEKKATADKSTDKFFAEKDYTPTLADLNTTDIDLVKRDHPLVYEAYLNFMNARGQAKPKLLETRAEYKGEILKHFKYKSAVTSRNNAGGLRLQSFSDFEVPHLIDMMQIVMDMSRVGLKSQAYTKVPAFAEVFGNTGVKINLSLIAKGDGLDANGNLVFDDVEGINHKEAFKLRDKYSKNVGTILVGKTDAHIIAAMADPRIDYIIPFHKSSWKESLYDALGLTGYADYTDTQHEKPIDKSRKISDYDPSEYWDFSKSGDENAQIYLEKCREDGRIPKFPQFQGYPGYWKLLIDFKMYDNDGIGSPQEVVKPEFNTEASERILREYKGGHNSFPVAKDVVEDFVKEHKDNVKLSDRYSYEALTSKPDMKLTMIGGTVPTNRADVVFQAKKNAASIGKANKDGSVSVYVKDVDADIVLSTKGLKHSLDRRLDVNAPVTLEAGQILQNSIRINELTPQKEEAASSYILIGAAEDNNGELYVVRSVVNKFSNELMSMDVLYAINAKKGNQPRSMRPGFQRPVTDSTISIAQLLDFVNRYFPDILPESVLKHYGYDARPEGELGENVLYSDRVTDKKTLDFLENQEHVTVYRAMQVIDGKLYPPMNAYTKDQSGKTVLMPYSEIGAWEQSVERPDLIDPKTGKFKLDKGKVDSGKRGTAVPAAYNPYIHTSLSMLNDQFTSAYQRSNLVVVKGVVPKSELTSGYHAQYAKDSVGETEWHSGVVSTQLPESRKVILSRWFKPVEIVKNDDVAESIKKMLSGTNIEIPYNVVSPGLRRSLENIGVPIGEGRGIRNLPKKDEVKYSDRSPNTVSTRSLLANALETAAQNDVEKNKLAQYKRKIGLIESEYEKLTELRAKIKELSFAKGARDAKAIKALQFEANEVANRINTYDRQLLNLESTTALKNVLNREKELARRKEAQKGKDAIAKVRENAAKTQRALMDKNTESRKKAIEGRNKTEMRHKIKSIVSDLNTLLLNPTAKKHIKEELRKEVANALSAINMDTVGADERIAKYNAMIAKTNDPDTIAELTKSRDNIQFQGDKLKDKLDALQSAYDKIKNTDDIELNLAYQEVIHNSIKNVSDKVGNTSIRNMSLEQLEMVYDLLKMIRHTIRDANKSFTTKKGETIMQMAEAVNDQGRTVGGQPYKRNAILAEVQRVGWTLLKPFVAFRTIGSVTFTNLYKRLRNGEDTFYGDVKEAQAFIEEQYKKHNYKSWDMKKTKTFTAKSGKTFNLTLEQMMTLYAYSRRDQAHKHIIEGGIVFEDAMVIEKSKAGIPIKYEVTTKDAFNLSEETFAEIANSLTAEQKAFVDAMQHYLSITMGAKGNDVSMELLGVKLFKEEFYLPIKSSQYYRNFSAEEAGEVKLKSPAFSKETVQHANNPIVLHNFTDLWAEHINDMSMYHSFVLALEDFTRVYNYKTKTDDKVETMDTKATLETAYPGVTKYINKFLKDMNSGVRAETVGWAEKLTSLAKKGSVLGSASVAIQQPSAVMRAMAMINPKYFVTTAHKSINLAKHKQDWAELKKYAPIAGIKEMGRFDVGMGQGTVDWIQSNKTVMEKGEDILSVAPAYMDEITWVTIWNAVKNETAHTRKDLRPGSDEFLKAAGERFTDVVSLSQVYDSVFSRSDLMRNKSWIAKALTAFMAEPTTTLNMLWDAYVQGKRTGSAKGFVKTTAATGGAVVASIVVNAALKAIVMAARDDDEDESYVEKYLESFFGDLKDNLNPLSLVPFVKDVVSIFKGYDVERMDMALFSDLKNAIDAFDSDNKTLYDKWSSLIGAVSAFFGIPVKNVERDVRALINTFFGDKVDTTKAGLLNAITEGWTGEDKSKVQNLYDAIISGDQAHIDRAESQYKDDSAIETATKKGLRENDPRIKKAAKEHSSGNIRGYNGYIEAIASEGHFDKETIESAIRSEQNAFNTKINEAAEAKTNGEDKEYKKIVRELRDSYKGIYTQDEIVELIKKAQEEQAKNKTEDDTEEATSIYRASDINVAFESGDTDMALEVIDDLIKTKVANGMDESKARSSLRSSMTEYWKPLYKEAYKSGNTAEKERIERILKASGLYGNASAVIKTCREWRTERD